MTKTNVTTLLHPVLLECCKFTPDNFWDTIFNDLAYGNTPYGFYFYKDLLSYKSKKAHALRINEKKKKKLYNDVYELLSKFGVSSMDERKRKQEIFEIPNHTITNWGNIRKKHYKDLLIELFAIDLKNKHNLSIASTRYTISSINIALSLNAISNADIHITDNRIEKIDGLVLKKGAIYDYFESDMDIYNKISNDLIYPEISIKTPMIEKWEKYLSGLEQKMII